MLITAQHNLTFRYIKIGNGLQRLGSCNIYNDIILSKYLVLLPNHLIDYIILHELTHTKIKNHSKEFYKLLNDLTGNNVSKYRKEMKNFELKIKPGDYSYSIIL